MNSLNRKLLLITLTLLGLTTLQATAEVDKPSYSGADRIVIENQHGLKALPFAIAELMINNCYSPNRSLVCPAQDEFMARIRKLGRDSNYMAAISQTAGQRSIAERLMSRQRDQYNDGVAQLSVGFRGSRAQELMASEHMFASDYEEKIAQYQAPQAVFARVLQGLFDLHLTTTTDTAFSIDEDLLGFLAQFEDEDGNMVLEQAVEKAWSAHHLARLKIRYAFLKNHDVWVRDGVVYEWQPQNVVMTELYFYLDEISMAGAPGISRHI